MIKKDSIPLTTKQGASKLVKIEQYDALPEYYILSGIILTPLSHNYQAIWGNKWEKKSTGKLLKYFYGARKRADEEVVINELLSSKITAGYQDMVDTRVTGVTFMK